MQRPGRRGLYNNVKAARRKNETVSIRSTFAALAALALLSAPASAQDHGGSDYMRASWTENDGLPGSAIGAMAQDDEGYLWLISSGGLVRFDGVRFVDWTATVPAGRQQRVGASTLSTALDGSLLIGL